MSGKFALIIGNTEYSDPGLAQLSAPGKDADDFARVLKDPNLCAFDEVRVLVNQVSSSVIEAVDEFFDQRKPDDLLVLFFSGHGVRDELGSLYLAVKNTIRSRLRSTAIKSDYIREVMDHSRSKRQVLVLDCCNSGAFPQGTKAEVGGTMGMVSAFQGYGRYVLTASDATQFAWEGNKVIGDTENSLFTHFLVKGLEGEADTDGDGNISVDELYDYAFEQIVRLTPKQKPNKSATRQEGEIILRQITRLEDIKPVSLPEELLEAIEDSRTFVREGAIQELGKLLNGKNLGLARSAREALERIETGDDSRRVAQAATQALASLRQMEAEQKSREQTERDLTEQRAAEDRSAQARAQAEQIAEEKRLAEARVEAERKARERVEQAARQKAEDERIARAKVKTEDSAQKKYLATENPVASPPRPLKPRSTFPKLSVLAWAGFGLVGLCLLVAGAWAIQYFAQQKVPTATQPPNVGTETPQATHTPASLTDAPPPVSTGEVFRAAVVLPSGINDMAFSQSMYASLLRVQQEMGKVNFEFVYSENMFVVDDAAAAIRDYASQGYDLVIAHGSQYGTSLQEIAPDFPETSFAWGTTADTFGQPNIFAYEAAAHEGGYVNGVLAASLSQNKVIGVVAPIETGDAKLYVDGFKAGAEATDRNIQVNVLYIGSFTDVALASEAATTHISAGADVMTGTGQMVVGAIGKAEENNVLWFGTQSSQTELAPSIVVANQVYHWEGILDEMITLIKNGTLGGQSFRATLANGGEVMNFNSNFELSEELLATAIDTIQGIKDGTINIGIP